jgi:hypothetical protein
MNKPTIRYAECRVRPELIRDANLLTIFLEADSAVIDARLPTALKARSRGRIVLNMWSHEDPNELTGFGGFGPMSVSYLAAEVTGAEGATADGLTHYPGRFWLHHWSSFDRARDYAGACGLQISPGETRVRIDDNKFIAQLLVDGRLEISASARVGNDVLRTLSGHSIYYAERAAADSGTEVALFEIPWVTDVFDASSATVEFLFEEDTAPLRLLGHRHPKVLDVAFRRITLVPYLAQRVVMSGPD